MSIIIVKSAKKLPSGPQYVKVQNSEAKGKLVDDKGVPISQTHQGRTYLVLGEYTRKFSTWERVTHCALGVLKLLGAIFSLGFLISFQSAFASFTQKQENVCYIKPLKNTQIKYGTTYIKPQILDLGEIKLTLEDKKTRLYFALIVTDTKKEIQLVKRTGNKSEYEDFPIRDILKKDPKTVFEAIKVVGKTESSYLTTVAETLGRIESNEFPSICNYKKEVQLEFIKNFSGPKEDFFKTLLQTDEKEPKIYWLDEEVAFEVLKNCTIPLVYKDYFEHYFAKNHADIIGLILEKDPSVLESRSIPSLEELILRGNGKMAKLLLEAKIKAHILLGEEEGWMRKILHDSTFFDGEFQGLPKDKQRQIYYYANALFAAEFMEKANRLQLTTDLSPWPYPSFSPLEASMDYLRVNEILQNRVSEDLAKGRLLTKSEYIEKLKAAGEKITVEEYELAQVATLAALEQIIQEKNYKYISTAKPHFFLKDGSTTVSLRLKKIHVKNADQIYFDAFYHDVKVNVEYIEHKDRKLSLEEALEFMEAVIATGFHFRIGTNVIFTENGIRFTPRKTSYDSFTYTPSEIKNVDASLLGINHFCLNYSSEFTTLKNCLDPKDVPAFEEAFNNRSNAFEKENREKIEQAEAYSEAHKKPFANLIEGLHDHRFRFPLPPSVRGIG